MCILRSYSNRDSTGMCITCFMYRLCRYLHSKHPFYPCSIRPQLVISAPDQKSRQKSRHGRSTRVRGYWHHGHIFCLNRSLGDCALWFITLFFKEKMYTIFFPPTQGFCFRLLWQLLAIVIEKFWGLKGKLTTTPRNCQKYWTLNETGTICACIRCTKYKEQRRIRFSTLLAASVPVSFLCACIWRNRHTFCACLSKQAFGRLLCKESSRFGFVKATILNQWMVFVWTHKSRKGSG